MVHKKLALVTGANGHLGNNLVRFLIDKGIPVRASVRNLKNWNNRTGSRLSVGDMLSVF